MYTYTMYLYIYICKYIYYVLQYTYIKVQQSSEKLHPSPISLLSSTQRFERAQEPVNLSHFRTPYPSGIKDGWEITPMGISHG